MNDVTDDPDYNECDAYLQDPDEHGESWEGMYNLMRCPIPRC